MKINENHPALTIARTYFEVAMRSVASRIPLSRDVRTNKYLCADTQMRWEIWSRKERLTIQARAKTDRKQFLLVLAIATLITAVIVFGLFNVGR